jgi:prepilin-type N-terminal cleavage/methylation domain-containing protein
MRRESGITLLELIIVMAIFSLVMAGLYSAHQVQIQQGISETRRAETSMEGNIASAIIERDFMMAGYGLAEDYSEAPVAISSNPPLAALATDNTNTVTSSNTGSVGSDTITLNGTAVAIGSSVSQGWTYLQNFVSGSTPTFRTWTDPMENLSSSNTVIIIEPTRRQLLALTSPNEWSYTYSNSVSDLKSVPSNITFPFMEQSVGVVVYGLGNSSVPYNTVTYKLGGTVGSACAPGTANLLRVENGSAQPVLNCVLDFQVAFGLDTDDDGLLDYWDNGGATAHTWGGLTGPAILNRRLKQIRAYILVQDGNKVQNYTYNNPDTVYLSVSGKSADWIRVGDINLTGGAIGRDFQLSPQQRSYKWKVLSYAITARNIR